MFRMNSFATSTVSRVAARSLAGNFTKAWLTTEVGAMYDKVAFIGTGKMAHAMMSPMIKKGHQPASKVAVFDVSSSALKSVKKEFPDIQLANSLSELVQGADLVVCAVKPQNVDAKFLAQFKNIRDDATFISILAGKAMSEFTGTGYGKIVRAMPNTPAMIGQGMTVWSCTENLTADDRDGVKKVLDTFGKSIYVDDEKFIDMSTSISGSGPAYIFLLMEAMIDAGVHMGFSRETATALCYHTLLGSTLYAMETGEHPAILRNMVTSPAGTTASAVYELENGKFRVVIKDAIWACYRRSLEMGGKNSDVGPGRMLHHQEKEIIHHHYVPSGEVNAHETDTDSDDETPLRKA